VITSYFIGINNDDINTIDRDINRKQVFIDGLWQSKVEVERKREYLILLFAVFCLLDRATSQPPVNPFTGTTCRK
jgi:hypothetical protein